MKNWQPIETAPKDGTHILVRTVPPGIRVTYMTHPPTVAHWFGPVDDENDGGWYLSVSQTEQPAIYPTEWMPLP